MFAGGESKEEMAPESGGNFDSRIAYRKAQGNLGRERKEGVKGRPRRGEERLNSKYPKSGRRDRCYLRENKSRLLPRRPRRARLSTGAAPSQPDSRVSHRPPFPTISLDGQKLPTWKRRRWGGCLCRFRRPPLLAFLCQLRIARPPWLRGPRRTQRASRDCRHATVGPTNTESPRRRRTRPRRALNLQLTFRGPLLVVEIS